MVHHTGIELEVSPPKYHAPHPLLVWEKTVIFALVMKVKPLKTESNKYE
jgi:hypothetical protein